MTDQITRPPEPWRQRLIRTLLYGRNVDRSAKARARALGLPHIKRAFQAMMDLLLLQKKEVSILFVCDDEMRILNRDYRHIDKPTDVLAFALAEGDFQEHAGDLLGDLVAESARHTVKALIGDGTPLGHNNAGKITQTGGVGSNDFQIAGGTFLVYGVQVTIPAWLSGSARQAMAKLRSRSSRHPVCPRP